MPIKPRPTTAALAGTSSPTAAAAWRVGLLLCGAALVALTGCEREGIQHYQAPKPPRYRLLGAIVPQGDLFWFFKLTGPEDAVAEHKQEFDAFLDSLTFADDKPPTWKLPAGWREEPGDAMRFATIALGPADDPLDLAVSRLPRDPAHQEKALLDNIDRWRTQLGLSPVYAEDLARIAPPRDLHGVTARVVDMVGPKPGKTRRAPGMPPGHPAPRPAAPPPREEPGKPGLRYTTPDGWKEVPPTKQFAVFEFQVRDNGQQALVTVSPLMGAAAGDLLTNVNRWRGQVGLPPTDADQLRRDAASLPVGAGRAAYVDLPGPRERMLGALLPQGRLVWAFKMLGPTELVARQKTAFEAFVKSVQFE